MNTGAALLACLALSVAGPEKEDSAASPNVTGANVPEHLATAVLHVNVGAVNASDENPGAESRPLRSISRAAAMAVANARKGVGTKVLIAPGVYRDQVKLPARNKGESDAPIVFEATEKGKAVLTGSDVFADWHKVDGPENIYWRHWPYKWGPREQVKDPVWVRCGIFYRPILLRRETVYVNGRPLTLVLSPLDLREGTNCVSEADEKLIVWLPKGVDARTALVEVPVRAGLFTAGGQKNVVLRGLVVKHDNSYYGMASACSFYQGSHILIEDCRFEWNNCGGYGFNTVRDLTVRRVASVHNGGSGVLGARLENVLFEDTENSHNNWRGHWGEFYGWSVGGTKFLEVRHSLWRRNRSIGNYALGFWFDYNCTHIVMDGCTWLRNMRDGIFIEANPGPITIRNSVIAHNAGGVMSTNSSRITLENNVLYGNTGAQIVVQGPRDRKVRCWNWGGRTKDLTVRIEDWTLRRNVIVAIGRQQCGLNVAYADPDLFMRTLASDGNVWFNADTPRVVTLAGVKMTVDEWRAVSGRDASSRFADPGFVDPGNLNFWLAGNSPILTDRQRAATSTFDATRGRAILAEKQKKLIDENWITPFPGAADVKPEHWHPVDLGPYANRPMRGKDGWMGVGGLTLDWLDGGRTIIQGVPFEILDPTDGKPAAIALRSFRVKTTGDKDVPAKVVIPIGRKIHSLQILHGCGWAKHAKVGQYRMVYEDGSTSVVDVVPYGPGSEHLDVTERMRRASTVQDWWPALPQIENDRLRHVIVANPENLAEKRYLYHLQWRNPTPQKTVKAIELESDPKAVTSIFVVAVTARVYSDSPDP